MLALSSSLLDARSISSALLALTLVFSVSACAKRWHDRSLIVQTKANEQQPATSPQTAAVSQTSNPQRININTAQANELETLPGIGRGLAARIIEHREKHGPFRRPEHLIIVRGISDRRFRALRDFVTVD